MTKAPIKTFLPYSSLVIASILLLLGLQANAQTTTNLTYKITVDVIVTGVSTNSKNATLSLDYAQKKDALKIDGAALAFGVYRQNGGTNAFENWLKTDASDRLKAYQDVKQQADNAALLTKIQSLLLSTPDLLSASDLTSLNTIAAKAP